MTQLCITLPLFEKKESDQIELSLNKVITMTYQSTEWSKGMYTHKYVIVI